EDLHAAADSDAAHLGQVADDLADAAVLVVATTRTSRLDALRPHLPHAAELALANLNVEAVRSLLAETLASDELADRLGAEVHRRTDGNPLAVLELLDAMRDAEVLVEDASGRWTLR